MLTLMREVEQLDVPRRKSMFKAILSTGKLRRTFPDAVIAGNAMIEIKRVASLGLTPQLEAQIRAARTQGLNYRIIVSDALIGAPAEDLRDFIAAQFGGSGLTGTIEKYDSTLGKLEQIWP